MVRGLANRERMTPQFSEGCGAIYSAHRDAVSGSWVDFPIPRDVGVGRIRSLGASGPIAACEHRMSFSRSVSFSDEAPSRSVSVGFCVGAEVEWTTSCSTTRQVSKSVDTDSLFIQSGGRGSYSICYLQDLEYEFVSLYVPLGMAGRHSADGDVKVALNGADGFEAPMTPAMRASLASLRHNAFVGYAGRLYAEGKILELLASVVALLDTGRRRENHGIPRSDREAVEQAKLILDSRLIDPPTYPELARMACLSESKLSRAFKQAYGVTIHAYVISCRLEWARTLIEIGKMSVAQAAATVGYANPSHFSQAFKERYGVSPSSI